MDSTPFLDGSNMIAWEARSARALDLGALVERAIKQPELLGTDTYRRRFSRAVRHALTVANQNRLDVVDCVEDRLGAASGAVAEALRELLGISLMPGAFPVTTPGLSELLAAMSGAKSAPEAGQMLLSHVRARFGSHVAGQVLLARPRLTPVAAVGEPAGGQEPFMAHWADGDRELGQLLIHGLNDEEREVMGEIAPWLQPTFRRLLEAERDREAVREALRESRFWELKAELLKLTQNPQSVDSYVRQAVSRVQALFGASQVLYWAYQAADDSLEVKHRARGREAAVEPPVSLGLFQEAIEGRSVQTAAVPMADGLKLFVLAPVFAEETLEGVLQVVMPGLTLNPGVEEELALVSEYLSAGLKTVRFYEQLSYHASQDPLTGLANRRTFQQFLDREYRLASRHGASISVMILDVDHFKRYNDSFGHPAGDALLVRLAQALTEAVRCTDFVARLGGEEFAIVLPHTDTEGARRVAEKVLEAVRGMHLVEPVLCRPVTASLGVASVKGAGAGTEALIEAADQALYAAKRGGRDRVELV